MANRWRMTWFDPLFAGVLVLFAIAGTGAAAQNQHRVAAPLSIGLAVAAAAAVAVWRVYPMWTLIAVGTCTVVYLGLNFAYGPILFSSAVAIYGMARRSPLRVALVAVAALLAATAVAIGVGVITGKRSAVEFVSTGPWLLVPAAVGIAVKARRDAGENVRLAQSRRAVIEERLRLAQEVHDVAGHGFAVVAMQAGVALRVFDQDPAAARQALEAIRLTSRESLDSLRGEVEALQEGGAAPLRPGVGLANLPALVDRIASSGLSVTVTGNGAGSLPEHVDRAAYRIIQESLTNVLRHAGPRATATVRLSRDADIVEIDVVDTGVGGPTDSHGRGIAGMRARASDLGGRLTVQSPASGGFAVRAMLPLVRR